MKANELCKTAIAAGLGEFGSIKYRVGDDWRYNVGLWTGDCWSFDCLGFVHCMVNGFCGNRAELGGGAVMDQFVTSTTEIKTLLDYCHDISNNFNNIKPGELLYMNGHVGLYVGTVQPFNDGRVFNVAECCYSSFGGGGMLTYVDETGRRFNHKGGTQAGTWERHGQFYRVDYTSDPVPDPVPDVTPAKLLDIVNEVFVGTFGNNPERRNKLTQMYGEDVYRRVQDIINLLYY